MSTVQNNRFYREARRSLKSFIPFITGERGEASAEFEGLTLRIWRATDAGFGYTAYRAGGQSLTGSGIRWVRTKRNCIEGLERIVERERAMKESSSATTPPIDTP